MNDKIAKKIKAIYTAYHGGQLWAEDALDELELIFTEANEKEEENN